MSRAPDDGRDGTVNPPVVRASTVLSRDIGTRKAMQAKREKGERTFSYGANGTPTTFALEDAINEVEGGARTVLFPTGLAAIAHTSSSRLKPGDHVLLAETVYGAGAQHRPQLSGPARHHLRVLSRRPRGSGEAPPARDPHGLSR